MGKQIRKEIAKRSIPSVVPEEPLFVDFSLIEETTSLVQSLAIFYSNWQTLADFSPFSWVANVALACKVLQVAWKFSTLTGPGTGLFCMGNGA